MSVRIPDRLLRDRVTIKSIGQSPSGDPIVEAESVNVRAFVDYGRRNVIDREGNKTQTTAVVFLASNASVPEAVHDRMRLVHDGNEYEVIAIETLRDPRTQAVSHYEVLVA